jgi:glucose-fructose oxidoreductase
MKKTPARGKRSTGAGKERPRRSAPRQQIRIAVIGLGHIAQTAVLPGIAQAKNARITALVSDDPVKLRQLARRYRTEYTCDYANYDEMLRSGLIDAVFIALPNDQHRDYAVRAAQAGVHVLCEKPMAVSAQDCRAMGEAAQAADVRLMIAYRLHFDPASLRTVALAERKALGELRFFSSIFSIQVKEGIRTGPLEAGGGPLYDLGIYCINAARYLFRSEPEEVVAVSAAADDPRFANGEETISVIMRFSGARLATFTASFGAAATGSFDLVGTRGSLHVDQAYEYAEAIRQRVTVGERTRTTTFPVGDQFAAEVDYFARCVLTGDDPEPGAAEGLADVRIIEAIHAAARTQRPVAVERDGLTLERPGTRQEIRYPAAPKVKPVRSPEPHD